MPFFSIILPTYNRAHFLSNAIESVLAQTFKDWELVIVDDGSTDNTKEVVVSYSDPRIVYIYQENQERSAARNNGIDNAKGKYICFLDSDDYFLDQKLKNYFEVLRHDSERKIILYDGLIFEERNTRVRTPIPIRENGLTIYEFLLLNPIGPLQVCIPFELLRQNKFNPELRIGEDVELWLRIAVTADFIPVQSFETVAVEHEERSVNLKRYNSGKEQLKQLKIIYSNYSIKKIRPVRRRELLSNCYFNSAKHFMFNSKRSLAIIAISKAILINIRNNQNKHRIFCLAELIRGKIPNEYLNTD